LIRLIYWLLALLELLLILLALLLFVVTDSRTINYIAKNTLESYHISYESLEGNLFQGLKVKKLAYKDQPLFSSALIHWNALSLLDEKLTITQLNAEGIEVENIIAMINSLKLKESKKAGGLGLEIMVKNTHLDINPYVYEGIKFSSFVLETGEIKVKKDLNVNAERLYLKFDSDIVNTKMYAKIEDSQLLIDDLTLNFELTKPDQPKQFTYHLTHRDINLGACEYYQNRIDQLQGGDKLFPNNKGLMNSQKNQVLNFSKHFKEFRKKKEENGFFLSEAKVNFILYWLNKKDEVDEGHEIKIVLPMVVFEYSK